MKRFARVLTGVVILIFCSPTPAKSFDWKELEDMSWKERAKKLEEVKKVIDEVSLVTGLDKKITHKRKLSKKEKGNFLRFARKYKLPMASRLQTIISKTKWSREDRSFLLCQLGLIIGHQKAAIKDHLNIRYWINTKIRALRDFDNNVKLQKFCAQNAKKIEKYRDFVASLTAYGKRLRRRHKT